MKRSFYEIARQATKEELEFRKKQVFDILQKASPYLEKPYVVSAIYALLFLKYQLKFGEIIGAIILYQVGIEIMMWYYGKCKRNKERRRMEMALQGNRILD